MTGKALEDYIVLQGAKLDQANVALRKIMDEQKLRELIAMHDFIRDKGAENPAATLRAIATTMPEVAVIVLINGLARQIQRRLEEGERP